MTAERAFFRQTKLGTQVTMTINTNKTLDHLRKWYQKNLGAGRCPARGSIQN